MVVFTQVAKPLTTVYLEDFHLAVWLTQHLVGMYTRKLLSCYDSPVLHTYNDIMYKYCTTFVVIFQSTVCLLGQALCVDPAILTAWPRSGTSAMI